MKFYLLKKIRRHLKFLVAGIASFILLQVFFVNCTGGFSSTGLQSIASVQSSLSSGTGSSSGTTPTVPIGPVPPVPPDFLPTAITPAWFGTHAVNEWFAIPNSVHAGSPAAPTDDPTDIYCNSTRRLSFSNIAQKGTQIVLAATGGHSDYSGNEVTGIELSADAPAWSLLHAGTPDAQKVPDVPYFLDGLPNSRHTYYSVLFSTTRNRLMLHRTRFMWQIAASSNDTNGFNLDNNSWDPAGSYNPGVTAGARDSHDNAWATANYFEIWKWTASTDTWARTGTFPNQIGVTMAHDSRRDQLYQLSWGDGQGDGTGVFSAMYDINGTTQTPITIQDSPAYQQFQADMPSNATMIYDPANDHFLFWDGVSGRLYQVQPNSTTTWQMSIVATLGTTPPTTSNAFGRMAYVPALRGVVVMPSGHQSLYFLRLN